MTLRKKNRQAAPGQTLEAVKTYREKGIMPKALTLRFLAMLKPAELRKLSRALKTAINNRELPATNGRARKRRQWAQYKLVESELRQREEAAK